MVLKKIKNKTKGKSIEEKTKENKTGKKTDKLNKVLQDNQIISYPKK